MLYLEDYLELIEHLPQELRDRFTDIREKDLQVQNSTEKLKEHRELFFAEAKKLKPEQRQCEYEKLLEEYQKSMAFADEKVDIASNLYDIMQKLIQRLDTELEKFKLELEADHSGITEELEKRSLQLDSDSNLDHLINSHLNNSTSSLAATASAHGAPLKISSGIKDRRKSAHRHHPYNNSLDEHDLQHHGRGKLSNHDHNNHNNNNHQFNRLSQNELILNGRQKISSSPSQIDDRLINGAPYSFSSINDTSINTGGDSNKNCINNTNELTRGGGHYENNLTSFGNKTSFKSSSLHPHHKSNLQNISTNLSNNSSFNYNHQHSALNANLTAANTPNLNSVSALAMMYAASVQNQKISGNTTLYHRDETKYCLCRQISYGEMVACDNNECEFEWFHYDCVNITRPPKGKWYCPDCLVKMSGQNHHHQQQNQSQTTQNKRAD